MRKPGDRVPGIGPLDARIVVVGESPGKSEDFEGRPFVGASGNLMKKWWGEVGINKYKVRIENVHEFRPPYNKIDAVPVGDLVKSIKDLHKRLAKLTRPYVLVPVGNYATFALTGKGKVKAALRKQLGEDINASIAEKKAGITVLRGSTYFYKDRRRRRIKVIPTIHPAAVLRTQKWEKRVRRDWKIIEEESHKKGYKKTERRHIAKPIQYELDIFLGQVEEVTGDTEARLAIDIETWGNTLSCVGFALSPNCSMTLPLVTKNERAFYMPYVKRLCECEVSKVFQGGWFDTYWLDHYGVKVNNYTYDTLGMHHCIDPVESHSLAFLASYFTRENYWKDEAKSHEEIKKCVTTQQKLWQYNGKDCCLTRELCTILEKELDERGLRKFYYKHYAEMYEPLLQVMRYGVKVNVKAQKKWAKDLVHQAKDLRKVLAEVAGEDLWAKKAFSPVKLKRFLYETLKCPKQKKMYIRKEGKAYDVSIDETALKRLTLKSPKKIGDNGLKILKVRKFLKQASVLKKGWDKDGRIRCTYKLVTEQGRLSSSKNPMGRGYNLQNIERKAGGIRTTFLPDDGTVFVRIDMSQSEDRFCKMYTRDSRMVEQANLRPTEYDAHIENAKLIFKSSTITKEQRNVGKMAVHASVDQQTQILTQRGFVFADCLTQWDKVAQWDIEDKKITFVAPLDYFKYEYSDAMYRFRNGFLSQYVTKDHRIPYKIDGRSRWSYAEDLPKNARVPLNGYYNGHIKINRHLVRLIVAACADATLTNSKSFRWKLKKEKKIIRLMNILNNLDYDYTMHGNKDGSTCVQLLQQPSSNLLYWLPNKEFSKKLLALCGENLDDLISELQYWDGNTTGGTIRFRSSNKNNLDWVQTICHLRGKKASLSKRKVTLTSYTNNDSYVLHISNYKHSLAGKPHIEYGKRNVYCLTVPSSFIVIRRNNCVSITGNSQRMMQGKTLSDRLMTKMDLIKTPKQCQTMINNYLKGTPAIESNYFPWVKKNIIAGGVLGNSWGRLIDYSSMFISQELFRKGCSFYLQSENVDLLNQLGFKFIFNYIKAKGMKSRLQLQVHDECILSCPPEEAYEITKVLVESLETERRVMGNWISIPACPTIGTSWDSSDCFEWNYLPERDEFESKVKEMLGG